MRTGDILPFNGQVYLTVTWEEHETSIWASEARRETIVLGKVRFVVDLLEVSGDRVRFEIQPLS